MPQLTKHILFKIPSGIHKAKLPLKLVSESKDCWQCNSFLKYFGYTRSSFQHEGSFSLITWDPFPWSRMEPGPPALGGRSLSHWTTRELPFFFFFYCPWWLRREESACNAGDLGSIPSLGGSPGGGHSNPLQYSCMENPRDRRAWRTTVHGVTKSVTQLSKLSSHFIVAL